jgi:hippurate hydrolase
VEAHVDYTREFIPLVNNVTLASEAIDVASNLFGVSNVRVGSKQMTASEDFPQFLPRAPAIAAKTARARSSPSFNGS